jgi:hypothetical protein
MAEPRTEYEKRERAFEFALEYQRNTGAGYGSADGTNLIAIADKFYDALYTPRSPNVKPVTPTVTYGSGTTSTAQVFVHPIQPAEGETAEEVGKKISDRLSGRSANGEAPRTFANWYASLSKGVRFFLGPIPAYERYIQWCENNGVQPLSKSGFLDRWDKTRGEDI